MLKKIKILIPIHVTPDTKSLVTMFFENLLPILQKHADVHLIWFVYKPDKINTSKKISDDITVLDIHDYNDAVELLKKIKPDIIFASATRSFIDYALSSAAKFLKIPTFSMFWSDWHYGTFQNKTQHAFSNISRFFDNSIPTDTEQEQKQYMRRGRFFVAKYLFLARTKKALKMNFLQIIIHLILIFKDTFFDSSVNPKFATNLHLLEDENLKNSLIKSGFDESTLLVTGNPIFDTSLKKALELENSIIQNNKINILFAPSTLYEHGFWTKKQRESALTQVISCLDKLDKKISITVKIHPSTSNLSEYSLIINKINSSIPIFQKGDIQSFIQNTDVVITFQSSTAEVYAIIAKKPIIICNFFNAEQDILVNKGVAIECKNPSNFLEIIEKASNIPNYAKNRDNFLNEFLYDSDGCAGERISKAILKLLNM